MMDFYDLIDTYASLHDIDRSEVLHLWYRGTIDAVDLLGAHLEDEGIYGYTGHLTNIIKTLFTRSIKDHNKNPWAEEGRN